MLNKCNSFLYETESFHTFTAMKAFVFSHLFKQQSRCHFRQHADAVEPKEAWRYTS